MSLLLIAFAPAAFAEEEEEKKAPDPEDISLEAKDGLVLECTWYAPATDEKEGSGKTVVPIILLHGWEGKRGDCEALAIHLRDQGHAVIAPDLRGHGGSSRYKNGFEIDLDRMRREDFAKMVQFDMEAIKKFLMDKNNVGEVNIELLCVIASDVSTIVAMNWVAQDWSWPQLPSFKQGQDVKAMILLSPERSFKGFTSIQAMMHPFLTGKLPIHPSIMVIVGADDRSALREAKTIHNKFKNYFPLPPREKAKEEQKVFLIEPDTRLQGTKMLDPRVRLGVERPISIFIQWRLVDRASNFPWTLRQNPLQASAR